MSITPNYLMKRPPNVFESDLYMKARVFNSLLDVVNAIEVGEPYRQSIDREAVAWYRNYIERSNK